MDRFHGTQRYEIKAWIPVGWTSGIRDFCAPFTQLDPHTQKAQQAYTVSSLYFDTPALDFYYEKLDGLKIRRKLRIRFYNQITQHSNGYLEIKRRYNNLIAKERARMSFSALSEIVQHPEKVSLNYEQSLNGGLVLSKFLDNIQRWQTKPTLWVRYDREAFESSADPSARLTIDHHVQTRAYHSPDDFFSTERYSLISSDQCLLEFKFNDLMPKWMVQLIEKWCVKPVSVSKYCTAVLLCHLIDPI